MSTESSSWVEPVQGQETMRSNRRQFLRLASLGGVGLLASSMPGAQAAFSQTQKPAAPISADMVAKLRASGATAVLKTEKLRDLVYVITGSGGNVAVLTGSDGKVMVDSGFGTSQKQFRAELAAISGDPLKLLINTHWHFDHTDGNEWLHKAGATVMAHENTRVRLSTPQDIAAYHLHFDPAPPDALPQQTFLEQSKLYLNGETIALEHYRPAHTDSDIFIHFQHANVFHAGDTFFSGFYPMIDASSGGSISGMIAAADHTLSLVDTSTKIIPGHGLISDRQGLQEYRDMMAEVQSRVRKLKQQGRKLEDVVAAKPTADLDAKWGKGNITPDFFVRWFTAHCRGRNTRSS